MVNNDDDERFRFFFVPKISKEAIKPRYIENTQKLGPYIQRSKRYTNFAISVLAKIAQNVNFR